MKKYAWLVILLVITFTALLRNLRKWILNDISSISFFVIMTTFTTLSALIYLLSSNNLPTLIHDLHVLTPFKTILMIIFAMLAIYVGIHAYNAIRMSELSTYSTVQSGASLLLTVIIAILFLKERPSLLQYLAISLVVLGILLFYFFDKK